MRILRILLFPFVPIYWTVTYLRNKLYDKDILKSKAYTSPIICVGNLSTGGTGKSPMIEYLIQILKNDYKIATLSRGYKRKTSGFRLADPDSTFTDIGDEPFQFYKNNKDLIVAVDAGRQNGIANLLRLQNKPDVILLDDAFQHRRVKAGLNILLTAYDDLYVDDIVLPTGDLREPKSGANRSDLVVVTKCPKNISDSEKKFIASKLKLLEHQTLYFSSIVYNKSIYNETSEIRLNDLKDKSFKLVTGIANPKPLKRFLESKSLNFEHLDYPDHHNFTDSEIEELNEKELIVTTEKDYVRLVNLLPQETVYYLPISITIDRASDFKTRILDFCESY